MPHSTDVVVIGAGAIGCAIAYELGGRGAGVTLIDSRGVAGGATHASAGILSPYIEGHGNADLLALGVRSLGMYDEFVRRAAEESGHAIPYGRVGTLEVALADDCVGDLEAAADRHRSRGIRATLFDAAGAKAAEPLLGDGASAALLIEEHAFVGASALSDALASAVVSEGGQIVTERVTAVRPDGDGLAVHLDGRRLGAGTVILAAGSWSSKVIVEGLPSLPVKPVRGQLIQLVWSGPALAHITWGTRCYLVPWPDGTVLLGATVEDAGFDERTTAAGVRDLLDAACELVPTAWQAGFVGARAGLRPASPDELPIVGWSKRIPHLVFATAHYRNGILLAPLTAKIVSGLVLDGVEDPDLERMSPQRFGDF